MDAKEILKMMAESNGGIKVAGDFVMEKNVEYEVANVESGGIGIQIVNGNGQTDHPKLELDEEQIVEELKKCFYGNHESALDFYNKIKDMKKSTLITDLVNDLVRQKIISEKSCNRDLYNILHKYDLYRPTESNWNSQIKK